MSDLPSIQDVQPLTVDQIKACIPKGANVTLTDSMVDEINNILASDEYAEEYRNNLLTYTSVLLNPKYKVVDYFNAVRFVTCKAMGDTNLVAYAKVFPDRLDRLRMAGKSEKDISAYTSAYAANQIVVKLTEQSMMPLHIVNNDKRQMAINVLSDIMLDLKQATKNRLEAADRLLAHLAPPKEAKLEINLGQRQASVISELRDATQELVEQQRQLMSSGAYTARQMAESKLIIDGEIIDDDHS